MSIEQFARRSPDRVESHPVAGEGLAGLLEQLLAFGVAVAAFGGLAIAFTLASELG